MSQQGYVIDSVRFARGAGRQAGEVEVAALTRLAGRVTRPSGSLRFVAAGSVEEGRPFLSVSVTGSLWLECQRCLEAMEFPVSLTSRLLVVAEGAAWPEDELTDDSYDAVPAQEQMDLLALVEEEVLLALPLAPRHEVCEAPGSHRKNEASSPFQALASLKRH